MRYNSTRDPAVRVTAAQAIYQGISDEGGLFVPECLPSIPQAAWTALAEKSYVERAVFVLEKFLSDFTTEEVETCARAAYTSGKFRDAAIAPLHELEPGVHVLELWHGPTCAFKDMALQMLPHLMRVSAQKTADKRELVILVATSGDTGKAALEGFKDAPGTKLLVFYPVDGVSPMQKLQMVTQEGNNVGVCAIRGNFDDAQTGVKAIFADPVVGAAMQANGQRFSSANSINWGRLLPQIVYYVSAYCDLLRTGKLRAGEVMNVVVPTGNFGNILAAYYAKKMGLPVGKLICASNRNRVLTDFIQTGTYDRNRTFHATSSPSMDILISSNLERLLFDLSGGDQGEICRLMENLARTGTYTVSEEMQTQIQTLFAAGWCDDSRTKETIARVWKKYGYLCDTHTAVGMQVYADYREQTGDRTPSVIASTANPYKFSASVLDALQKEERTADEFEKMERLEMLTGCPIPPPLAHLRGLTPRFTRVCDRQEMSAAVHEMLEI